MKNHTRNVTRSLLWFLIVTSSTSAMAQLYVRPRAGARIPIHDGDMSYTAGLTAGYQWADPFATELSYSRMFGTGNGVDGDVVEGEALLSFPLPYVRPHLSAGVGMIHSEWNNQSDTNSMILLGAGVSAPELIFLSLGAGVSYSMVLGGADFLSPYVSVGLAF